LIGNGLIGTGLLRFGAVKRWPIVIMGAPGTGIPGSETLYRAPRSTFIVGRPFVTVLAEREGFEPSIRETRIPDFESGAFDHSATFPGIVGSRVVVRERSLEL
jgi:hypothetical protein